MARHVPAAEVDVTADLVRGLLRDQHPDLAGLPLEPFASGWDNALFRLGDELAVRMPRRQLGADLVDHLFRPAFGAAAADAPPTDSAVVEIHGHRLAFTTDSYVVQPLVFPGGDIGSLAVHGTEGLHLVDASIMPIIPNANLHSTVVMLAEKASDHILGAGLLAPEHTPFHTHEENPEWARTVNNAG